MTNRTQGGGRFSQVFPVIDPRQAPLPSSSRHRPAQPTASTAAPAPQPRPAAPRHRGPHPLQRQSAAASSGPAAAPLSAPLVGRNTTVLDTVRWNTNAHLEDIDHFLLLGDKLRGGDPRLGRAQTGGDSQFKLSLNTDRNMPVHEVQRGQANAREAALTILYNTECAFRLPSSSGAARIIDDARKWLANPGNSLTAGAFADTMKAVSEAVHAHEMQKIGPSRAPRETGRSPMDCMTHLGYEVRHARDDASKDQKKFLRELGDEIMDRVLQHKLGFRSTKAWLNDVKTDCQRHDLRSLGRLAGRLSGEIPEPGTEREHATLLHDNVYGRALESVLISELVRKPPNNVKQSMIALSDHLDQALSRLPPDAQQQAAVKVQAMMRKERRGWQAQSPELEAFFQAPRGHELRALQDLLRSPMETGADCIAVPYLTVKLSLSMGDAAPWLRKANANYRDVVGPAAARQTESTPNPNRIAPKAGITSHHQPDTVPTHPAQASMHPGDRNRPALHAASRELRRALQYGAPFVSGVSGSTNIVMHAVGDMLEKGGKINAKDALLGTMMFLTHDGGHSMHEAMWVGNQLDRQLNLGIGMPGRDPSSFVADYEGFIESFSSDKVRDTLWAAADTAWKETLNQFGRTSHFSADNPPP